MSPLKVYTQISNIGKNNGYSQKGTFMHQKQIVRSYNSKLKINKGQHPKNLLDIKKIWHPTLRPYKAKPII